MLSIKSWLLWFFGKEENTEEEGDVCVFKVEEWYNEGILHRIGGPAITWSDGTKEWYCEGALHREDGSAIEHANGDKEWFSYGVRHREDGPAIVRNVD
jgi:hypothetical protein